MSKNKVAMLYSPGVYMSIHVLIPFRCFIRNPIRSCPVSFVSWSLCRLRHDPSFKRSIHNISEPRTFPHTHKHSRILSLFHSTKRHHCPHRNMTVLTSQPRSIQTIDPEQNRPMEEEVILVDKDDKVVGHTSKRRS